MRLARKVAEGPALDLIKDGMLLAYTGRIRKEDGPMPQGLILMVEWVQPSVIPPCTLAGAMCPGRIPAYAAREPETDRTVSANWAGEGTMVTLFSFSSSTFSRALSPAVLTMAPACPIRFPFGAVRPAI